jgi:DNA-binding transcriptional LysR family regulator
MDLKQLSRFLAVVDQGSFSAAARHLSVTQQALSASISALENEVSLKLFERSPGGITKATVYGRALIRHARSQFASLERAKQELRAIHDASSGTITIGVGEVASDVIAAAIKRLHSLRPDIRINVIEGYSEQLLERLTEGEFDFVVAGTGGLMLSDRIEQELLFSANDILLVRAEHPLAGKSHLTLKALQHYTWMVPYTRNSDLEIIVEAFVAEKLEPPRRLIGTDTYTIGARLILNNDFIIMTSPALVSDEENGQDSRFAKLDIDRPTVRRHAHILFSSDHHLSPAAAIFYQEIKDICFEKDL